MSTAKEIREQGTRTMTTAHGFTIKYRKPCVLDLIRCGLGPIVASTLPPEREDIARMLGRGKLPITRVEDLDLEGVAPMMAQFLAAVMLEPRLHVGDGPVPDDAVTQEELGDAMLEIFSAAMECYSEGVGAATLSAATFRVDANGQAGEPSSAVVSDDADADSSSESGEVSRSPGLGDGGGVAELGGVAGGDR